MRLRGRRPPITERNQIELDSGLPAAVDVEIMVLGAMLTDHEAAKTVFSILDVDDFSLDKHRVIFAGCRAVYDAGSYPDLVNVRQWLHEKNKLESIDGTSYLATLGEDLPQVYHLDSYIGILRKKTILRRAAFMAQSIMAECCRQDADTDTVRRAEAFYRELATEEETGGALQSFGEFLQHYEGGLQEFLAPKRGGISIALPWASLTRIVPGFGPGQVIVLAARPGFGKSAFMGNVGVYAARSGSGVGVFSREMSSEENWRRMISGIAQVELHKICRRQLNDTDRYHVKAAAADLDSLPIWIDESPDSTPASLDAALQKHRGKGRKLGLVIVDYLQLMRSARRQERRNDEVAEISRQMKLMALEYKVPFLVLSQLSRDSVKRNERPQLQDLRDSGAIEQDADVVMFLYQDPKNQFAEVRETEVLVRKQRNGPLGKVRLNFNGPYLRFDEMDESDKRSEV